MLAQPITRGRFVAALMAMVVATSVVFLMGPSGNAAGVTHCPAPPKKMTFAPPKFIDTTRAGGEPTVEQHPNGTLLYGSHAGTTHFYAPAGADPQTTSFFQNYNGQTYYYYSDNLGKTWHYVPRVDPKNLPGQGFSDPEFGIDKAGQVYISEINLANVAVSKSTDAGHSYALQNFFGETVTDRQWQDGDQKNVVYITGNSYGGGTAPANPVGNLGHYLYKSKDGGQNFGPGTSDQQGGEGLGDIHVDKSDGTLYEAHYDGSTLSLAAFRKARSDDLTPDTNTVAKHVKMLSHWPAFDLDPQGNLYMTWDESGKGPRASGIWYSYSKDRGNTWAKPVRVDTDKRTNIWPWLAVGSKGRVAVAYLQADKKLPGNNAETPGTYGWRVVVAQTLDGLGCKGSSKPGFRSAIATPKAVHKGTICQGGTVCQAQKVDRRMGDFFTIEIDNTGRVWGGYSDTSRGGGVALPGFLRQSGGSRFISKCRRGASRQNKKRGRAGPCMFAPLVGLGTTDRTPRRGEGFRLKAVLRACKVSHLTDQLKGTRVDLMRRRGDHFVKVGSKRVNSKCRTSFSRRASFRHAVYKAVWPKQLKGIRRGRSFLLRIRTHS
jgi:hypothetical protein